MSLLLILKTENRLPLCQFLKSDILKIINSLDSNKAHGHDMIKIRILKLAANSVC